MTETADIVTGVVASAGAADAAIVSTEYDADSITVLKGLEAVRLRPGMYIGDTSDGSGLHHMIYEVTDNGIDEALGGFADKVTLTINADGSATVTDNGRGIPVDMHKEEGRPAIEVIMTDLHAGGKFNQNSYKVSGGLHGVGVSVVNALSKRLEVTVFRNDQEYFIAFEHGLVVEPLRVVGPATAGRTGTNVTFWPSEATFGDVTFVAATLIRRMRELSFLNSKVSIIFQDLREGSQHQEPETFYSENGIEAMVVYLDRNEKPLTAKPIVVRGKREGKQGEKTVDIDVDIAFQWNSNYKADNLFAFTNNIPQGEGGSHVSGFKMALTKVFTDYAAQNLTGKNKIAVSGEDIREGMTAVISVKVPDPRFSSQTKHKLVSGEVQGAVQTLLNEVLPIWLDENPTEAKRILAKIAEAAVVRAKTKAAREQARKVSPQDIASLPDKLYDCQTKKPAEAEVFIVEGDSAGGSAKDGRNRYNQAILPLRGKVLNVERARMDKVYASEQIGTLIMALGCGIDDESHENFDVEKVRYHKIIIMSDADVDGNHIRTLLLTFFFRKMPQLIERGFIYIAQPPLYKITRGKTKTYLLNDDEKDQYILNSGLKDTKLELSDGTVVEGDALIALALSARANDRCIQQLAEEIGNEDVATAMAVAGFFAPAAFETEENRQALAEYLNELLTDRTTRTIWKTEAVGSDIELTWRFQGVTSSCKVHGSMVKKQDAITLTRNAESLGTIYGPGAVFTDAKGVVTRVTSPGQLFQLASDAGNAGISIQRYKGLGEMDPEELKETTLDPENRVLLQVRIKDPLEANDTVSTLMGDDVPERRQFIIDNSKLAEIDF